MNPVSGMSDFQCELLSLHIAFVNGSPAAGAAICKRMFPRLVELLRRSCKRRADEYFCDDAVSMALWDYLQKPGYDPAKQAPLDVYLFWLARGRLSNAVREQRRRTAHETTSEKEIDFAVVTDTPADYSLMREQPDPRRDKLARIRQKLSPGQRTYLDLRRDGARDPQTYIRELKPELSDAPIEKRRQFLKNFRDTLMRKTKNIAEAMEDE